MTASEGVLRLVFDTTCLSHFARADRLDVLGDLLTGIETSMPQVVREEIRDGVADYPQLIWGPVLSSGRADLARRFAPFGLVRRVCGRRGRVTGRLSSVDARSG